MKNQSRIVIENISPEINNGDFNIKRVVNEIVNVSADVMADGHDIIATSVLFKHENSKKWEEVRMSPHFDNKWSASFTVQKQGFYSYKVIGWVDYALNWQHGISRKIDDNQSISGCNMPGTVIIHNEVSLICIKGNKVAPESNIRI